MKKFLTILVAVLITASVFAQAPEKMSYQAVIRNSSDQLVTGQAVGMQISILQGSASGTAVYVETQSATTNANGLVSIEIGTGTVVSGDFTAIDWSTGPYFIKTETDPTGGTNYTIIGTSQLLSVPYALYAKTSGGDIISGSQIGEMLYWDGTAWVTVAPGSDGQMLSLINGVPTWIPIMGATDVYNPTTGKVWMNRNLGASRVATAYDDYQAYGSLYQWGRLSDGHEQITWTSSTSGTPVNGSTSTLSSSDNPGHSDFITINSSPYDWRSPQNDNLWQGVNGINNPCPSGYRLPTYAEWDAERQSWSSNDAAGAFASPLKLTLAGYRNYSNATLGSTGVGGCYWSSTVDGTYAYNLNFGISNALMYTWYRSTGYSVRCIKD